MVVQPIGALTLALLLAGCSTPARDATAASPVRSTDAACQPSRDTTVVLWSCRIAPGGALAIHELSGIYYDRASTALWAVSDESRPDADGPARLLEFGLSPGPAITFRDTRRLTRQPAAATGPQASTWQLEAIAPEIADGRWTGSFFVASEQDTGSPSLSSQIYRCTVAGECRAAFALPAEWHSPADGAASGGMADNQGIEGLTVSPDGARLFAALERPLVQDAAAPGRRARVRLIEFAPTQSAAVRQYVYELDPRPGHVSAASGEPGVSEILAVSSRELLVLERSYSTGCGNTVRLFQVTLDASLALAPGQAISRGSPLPKRLLVDFTDEKASFDDAKLSKLLENFEGMTFGPPQPDGSPTLLLVSDDNDRSDQITALIGLRMASLPAPAARRWRDGDPPICPGVPRS